MIALSRRRVSEGSVGILARRWPNNNHQWSVDVLDGLEAFRRMESAMVYMFHDLHFEGSHSLRRQPRLGTTSSLGGLAKLARTTDRRC